jgi:hypothetical protein
MAEENEVGNPVHADPLHFFTPRMCRGQLLDLAAARLDGFVAGHAKFGRGESCLILLGGFGVAIGARLTHGDVLSVAEGNRLRSDGHGQLLLLASVHGRRLLGGQRAGAKPRDENAETRFAHLDSVSGPGRGDLRANHVMLSEASPQLSEDNC